MKVSREYAIGELESVRKTLSDWIRELKVPSTLDHEGKAVKLYGEDGPPKGLSVESVEGIPVDQLRAEIIAIAGKLEALATAS